MKMKGLLFILITCMVWFGLEAQDVGVTGDSTINQCETKTYTISILNNSGNPLTNLEVTAKLGNLTGFSYVTGTAVIDVNGGGAFCTVDPTPSGTDLIWDIDAVCPGSPFTLNDGDTLNIAFNLVTDCTAVSGSLNVHFEYEISGTPMTDDTGSHSIQVLPGGVTIKKTPNVIPQELGQDVTWTLTIENSGFGTIKNVVVTDVLDAGLAYVSSTPAGVNAGQTTTWGTAEIAGFATMNPGQIITIDITAKVIACEFLDNTADARWGCDLVTDCYNTALTVPPSTATAAVQRIVKSPLIQYTPPNVTFNYCDDYADVSFTITNTGDGRAHDVWLKVDFGALTVSNLSAGAIYNNIDKRFELTDPLEAAPGPGNTYTLGYRLNYNTWCGGSFPTGDLLWQTVYKDDCDNEFYPPVELSAINAPANTPSLSVGKSGGPSVVQIGDQVIYTITSSYTGPLNCGSGSTGDVTVTDTLPAGFTVLNAGGGTWVPGGEGTGGTITWTYTPPATLNTSITVQVPNRSDCEKYCHDTYTNNIAATVVDCCGCTLNAAGSQTLAIECEELVDSDKTASPVTGIRCTDIQYTNTYTFADNATLDTVDLSELIFREIAENEQEYVGGSLQVTLSGSGDITACAQTGMTDTTPGAGGNLSINFSNCNTYGTVRNKTLTITYRLRITEDTVSACGGITFYSWSRLDMGMISGAECLPDGIIYETTPVSVDPPAMSLTLTGLGYIIDKCQTQTITLTLTQSSVTANPKDVRLVLSGLNYYVVNPAATVCSGDVAPTSCTPVQVGDDYVWYFADGFNGPGKKAVLQMTVQKRCTGTGDLAATAFYDDNCHDDANYDDTCSVTATETPGLLLNGDLLIEKTPEVFYAATNTILWKIYITNRGNGSAYNVWVDDELGSGLDYVSAVVNNMTGVTVTADQDHNGGGINGCTIAIAEMTAGQRREITFTALLVSCNNLTNDVSTSWGCVGLDCQAVVSDNATVEIPRPLLINTNVVTTPADACTDPSGLITLKNAGQTTCYDLQITENLPAGLNYIPGTTRWRLNGGGWNGPNAAYDPVVSGSPEQLAWTSTQIAGLAVSNPGDTIEIDFDLSADCPFSGGDVKIITSYKNPCGQVFSTSQSVFTVAFRAPKITVTKTRASDPIDCGELVEWTITVQNTSGYTLPIIWVEDVLGAAFTYQSSVGNPPFTIDNGTFDGVNKVSWELRNVNHNDVVNLTIRATADNPPCNGNVTDTVTAWWGCGAADGSSATKPGVNPPDNGLCLTTVGVNATNTPTREPSIGFLDIALNPLSIDSCNDNVQLTVTIENTGPTDARNVDLVITLPAGITYNAGSSTVTCGGVTGPAADPGISGNQLTYYNINNNPAGKASNLCDTVQAAGGNDTVVLVFSVRSECYVTADVQFDLYYYDCCEDTQYSGTDSQTVTALYPDISISKVPTNSQVDCGTNQTWTITVTNNGTGNAQVVRIEDTLGNWIDYIGSAPAATPIPSAPTQVYGWEINNLGPGASQSFDITGQLNPDAPQDSCSVSLRQNNVRAIWGCGVAGDPVDGDPNTTSYDCTYTAWSNAPVATLSMPDLVVTSITPVISCTADGTFSGTIQVGVRNQGDGTATGGFQVQVNDGTGWTGTGTYAGNLAAGGSTTINIDVTSWNPDCSPCTYSFTASVDSGNTICECREDNNNFGPQSYSPPIPNLQVSADTLAISCVADGQYSISGSVTLRNAGCSGTLTQDVPMRFTLLSGAGCGGAQIAQWTQTFTGVSIAAGNTQTFTITAYNINGNACTSATGCQFSIRIEADYTNAICECDGTDNTRCSDKTFTIPDLRVSSETLAISCSVDGQIRIQGNLVVANDGCGANFATNIPIRIRVYNNPANCLGAAFGTITFNQAGVNIPAGGTQTFAIDRTLNRNLCTNSTGCQVALGVELDYTSAVCECNGTNNSYCSPNRVVSIPDLQVTGDTLSVNCLQDGQVRVSGTATIANTGCNAAVVGNLPVRFTLFNNINCGGVQLDQWTETFAGANIAAGGNQVFTITNRDIVTNICTNSTGCQVSLRIEADPGAVICECNGGNNSRCSNKTVSVPDLRITAVTPLITCTTDGTLTGTVQVTVNNNGCGAANNIPVRLTSNCGYTFTDQTIAALAAGASTTLTFSFTPNAAACTCTFTAAADPDNVVCECDGTNNSLAAAPYTSPVPDLTITDIDFSNVTCANDNISGSVMVTVRNQGCGTANNFQVSLTTDGCLNFTNQTVVTLAAGASTNLTFNISGSWANCTDGDCQFTAAVDAPGTVCEYDGTNNTRTETYNSTLPDLVVTDIDFSGITCANDNISGSVAVTINNQGFGNAANFQVSLATDGCLSFTNQTVANLAAGAGTVLTFNVSGSWADCTDCNCVFTATVDPTNTVCECRGTNNNRVETYDFNLPDLRVNSVTPDAPCVAESSFQGTVTVNVSNTGCAAVNNAVVRMTSSCGYVFADQTVNLAAGASANLVFTYTPTCSNCSCTFTATIDPAGTVCECNGTNNAVTSDVFNLDVPDITVEADTLEVTCDSDGLVTVSGTVTLGNHGCGSNLTLDVPVRISLYDNTGCTGNRLDRWTERLTGVNIPAGGGTQAFTITNRTIAANLVTSSTNCRVSLRIEADYVVVDVGDAICECNGTNNNYCTADKNVDIPDLQVTGDTLNVTCAGDGQVTVSGTVTMANSGCGSNLNTDIPVRFTLYDNTGCSGSELSQWTETLSGVNIAAGGGTQVFTITPSNITTNLVTTSTNCRFSLRVEADYTAVICESDDTNNTYCADNKAVDIPDLQVSSDTLGVSCLADGQVRVSGTVTMVNNGCGSNLAANIPVRFTLYDNTGCAGNVLSQWTETLAGVNIAAGGGTQVFTIAPNDVTANICTSSSTCQVSILIEADYTDSICESDGTNNTRCTDKAIAVPDLTVNSVTPASTCVNDSNFQGTVTVNVTNTGCGAANNAVVRMTSSCGYAFTDQTVTLAAGASANLTFTYTPTCPNCTCTFTAAIDPDDTVCECDGTNNTLTSADFDLDIPDVTVEADTLGAACAADGQVTVSGTVTLGNRGCGSNLAANVPVRFTLYDNTGCAGNQVDQWTQTFSGVNIAAGGATQVFTITNRTIAANLVTNSTGCRFSLRVEADYNDSICECDGTNNTYCADNKAVDIPDLRVTGDTLGVTCLTDGQVTVSGTVTMTNNGCGSNLIANIPVRYTLFNNTGCGGSQVSQWTETLNGVNIVAGGGTQVFTITPRNITTNLVTNSTNCQVSIRVEADYTNAICENDGTNNTYCADNKAVDIPDLQVSNDTLGVSCLADGQVRVSGTVTMVNNGCGTNLAANIPVRFTLYDNTGCTGNQLSQWTETLAGVNIAAGGGTQVFTITPQNVTANICTNSSTCQVSILIEADYTAGICESDGTDNTRCTDKAIAVPDLTVNSVTPSFTCVSDGNLQGTVVVNVSNIGCGTANGAVIRLTSDCGITFTDQTINLAAGASTNVTFNYTPVCTACTCIFTATLDPLAALCECDGTNNTLASAPFTMTVPDIEVQTDTLAVTCAGDNQVTVSGTVTLLNNGCGANLTADIPVRFTLLDNTGCSGNQLNQWTQTLTAVNIASGGGTQVFTITPRTINANLCTNSTGCRVSIRVEADYNNSVCECDGTDNTYCADNKAVDIPDLLVQSDTLGVTCAADGQVTVSGTVTMTNTGCGTNLAADIPVRFTLYDNTGCSGNQLLQWTQTLTGVNIASGGGIQVFTITPPTLTTNLVDNSTNCRVSIRVEPDYTNVICECNNANNTYCADNKAVDIPDIEIQGDTLGLTCINDGQYRVSGTVTLRNNGCGSNLTSNVAVRFTLNDGTGGGCTGTTLLQWTETFAGVNIPAGGTQVFTITARDASADLCSAAINNRLFILMEADYTNAICESDGTDNTLCSEKTVSIPELVVNIVASTVVCNSDGSLDGTTVNVSNIGNAAATGVVVRLTSDCGLTFADETVNLAAGETREVFFPFTAGIVTCVCNFTAVIDPDNTVCECSGTNNTRTSTANMLIPDLEVQSETLAIDCLEDGVVRVTGTVTLVNNGCGPNFTGNIPMRFSLNNRPGCGGSLVNQWTQTFTGVNLVSAGGTQTFNIQTHDFAANFCTNSTNCQVSILIEADYSNTICEWDGTDNTYCTNKTSDCLDLEAVSVTPNTNCAGDAEINGTIAVTVRNSGGNPITQDFSIRVDDGQGWSSELRYHADLGGTLPLPAGATSTVTFNWNRVFANETCHYSNITAVVDSRNEICQCTTKNDTATNAYEMPLPNLRPTAITPQCSGDGQYLVRVTVENNGCGSAGSFTVHLADSLGHTMDIIVDSLAKGNTAIAEFPGWLAACDPKTVIFTATVDSKNTVCEITGTDNSMEITYTNTSPDLVITEVKPSTSCNAPGNVSGTFTLTLENKGNGPVTRDFKVIVNDGEGWSSEKYYQADLNGVLPIAAGAAVTLDVPWNRDFTGEPFKCDFNNITVGLDLETNVCECGTANNETVATYRLPYPDLVLQSLLPMCQEDGKRQIQLTMGNKGCADQGDDFNITFTDSLGGSRTVSFTALGGKLPLRTGATQNLNLADWEFNCAGGTTVYTATIAVGAGFCDLNSANNTLTYTHVMGEPDLLFGDIISTCNGDGSITFTVTVLNQGKEAANNVSVRIYDGNENLVHSRTMDLPAGVPMQFSFTTGSYPPGQMLTFRFVVDEEKQFCECDGSNNEKSTNIRCEGGGESPLKLAKFCPHGHGPGGLFKFELQISNTGGTDLADVKLIDFLPDGFQYVKGSSALNGQSIADPQITTQLTWTIAILPKGVTWTLIFTAVADADIDPGRYCNEALAEASLPGSAVTIKSDQVQCCTVVPRQPGAGCCLKAEEWGLSPWHFPDGPLSFIEPYFPTEYAMYTVYTIFNLWQDVQLEKGTMPLFMKERMQNYARSTIEEFYLNSKLGLTQPDNTLWLSYAGAYPEREHSWVRKQVDETMTASQLGFELLALNEAVKIEERENLKQKLQNIIQKKLTFLGYFLDELPHAWEINDNKKDKNEVEAEVNVEEAIKKYVKKQDDKATLYDKAALYLAMVELKSAGTANAETEVYAKKLREMLKSIDGQDFDRNNLREEFLFTLALLETGQTGQARAKIREFEKILATEQAATAAQEGPYRDRAAGGPSLGAPGGAPGINAANPSQESKNRTGGESAAKTSEETRKGVLDNLHDYALAAAVDYKAGGTLYKEIKKEMQDKYYLQDVGIFAEKQPDFTFKLKLHSLAPLILSFDTKEPEEYAHNATVLYRTFDEVGLFLKKRNLSIGKPLYSLLKNYPFTEPLLPVLSFTRANGDIAPVFSRDAVVHSTQLKPIGEILIPGNFSKILSPSYETGTSRVAAASFGFQYLGRLLKDKEERVIKEEGRSLDETGKAYIDSLLKSGAGIQYKGKTLLPYDHLAVKGPKKDEHNLEALDAGTGAQISTEALANYLLAEKLYVEGKGKYAEAVQEIMAEQDRVVEQFKDLGYIPEKFGIFMEEGTGQITLIPSKERVSRLTAAKLYQVLPGDKNHEFLASELKKPNGKLRTEDLIFIAALPELVPYFKEEIKLLVDYKDSQVAYNAADVVGRRLLGDDKGKIEKSLENLHKHWDKEVLLPTSDRIEDIEKGLIYHYEPQQFLLYLLAAQERMDFRFERTLNFFTYLLENEWGVEWESYITLPSLDYEVFKEEPKENAEPGDLLTFRVRVDNTCPEGYGSAYDLPSLYLKAAFRPSLIYAGTQRVEGLNVLGDFQWYSQGLTQGAVLEYLYQAIVPTEFNFNFISGWIYAGGRQGYEEFGPESASGDRCEDIYNLRRLNIIPFETIQGLVYEDRNVNGIKDVGERGVANILIKDTRGRLFRSDAEGRYSVLAGDEHEGLQVELKSVPYNYLMIENPTKLVNRRYTGEIYFGLIPCTTVTGFVYQDENRNGGYDDGEARPEGVMLKAKDKEVLTGKDGRFIFRNLPELWKEWIEVKKEQWYYKAPVSDLKFRIEEK